MKEKSHCTRYRIKRDAPTKLDIVASEVLTSELYQAEFWVTYNDSAERIVKIGLRPEIQELEMRNTVSLWIKYKL